MIWVEHGCLSSHNSHHDMHSWLSGRNHSLSCRGGAAVLESGKCAALQIMKERCCFDIASLLSHSAWQILSWTWWSREKCLCYGQKSSEEKRLWWCSDFGKQQARPPQCSGTLSHTHTWSSSACPKGLSVLMSMTCVPQPALVVVTQWYGGDDVGGDQTGRLIIREERCLSWYRVRWAGWVFLWQVCCVTHHIYPLVSLCLRVVWLNGNVKANAATHY